MSVQFPIGLHLKDCGDVELYESIAELEDGLEIIDVENEEYGGWDALNFPICLYVQDARASNGWLGIRRASEHVDRVAFATAIRAYASNAGLDLQLNANEQPIRFLERVETAYENRPRPSSAWQRLVQWIAGTR